MFEIDWKTPHLWRRNAGLPGKRYPSLDGDANVDIAVVGGGFTGLAAAIAAAGSGSKVMLLEGNEIGSAASGRNNGLLISHHSKASPSEIEAALGPVYGPRYNALVAEAAPVAFERMRRYGIDCDQVQKGWIQPAHSAQALQRVRKFCKEWQAFGQQATWLDAAEVSDAVGSRYEGGWLLHNSGHVNPYAAVLGFAAAAANQGVDIRETAQVTAITRNGPRWRLTTAQGSVTANQVVVATNALTGKFWPGLNQAMIPIQVFQGASAPIPPALRAAILKNNPAVSDTRRDIRAFHYDRDFRIVTGGTHTVWFNARERGLASLQRRLAIAFPQLGNTPQVEDYWEGVLAAVPDRKPRLMRLAPGMLFGGIYSGRGVALSVSFGEKMGLWAAGKLDDAAMPIPVTDLSRVPYHPVAVQVARRIHVVHRVQDRLS
ncbi:NAD(P)/FAD-dependent oxidoreductase [Taklimakanibacter lacteus]|uniref:NAD(P)/FAD-dependent oxidoreductase n=1 Tax=Taklimakanibacter lacteus TaxID=2268456 RepID=UPI000E66DB14